MLGELILVLLFVILILWSIAGFFADLAMGVLKFTMVLVVFAILVAVF